MGSVAFPCGEFILTPFLGEELAIINPKSGSEARRVNADTAFEDLMTFEVHGPSEVGVVGATKHSLERIAGIRIPHHFNSRRCFPNIQPHLRLQIVIVQMYQRLRRASIRYLRYL